MFKEPIPRGLSTEEVQLVDSSGVAHPGRAAFKVWTKKDSFVRGFRKAFKIVGILIGMALPFAFLEPFAFMVWGGVWIGGTLFLIGPYFHLKYAEESVSFFYVEGICPNCKKDAKLESYVSTAFTQEVTVICPECGQTCRAVRKGEV